jgi:hypothetical protein
MGFTLEQGKKAGNFLRLPLKPSNSAQNSRIFPDSREFAGN